MATEVLRIFILSDKNCNKPICKFTGGDGHGLKQLMEDDNISFQAGLKLLRRLLKVNDGGMPHNIPDMATEANDFTTTTHMSLGVDQSEGNATKRKLANNHTVNSKSGKADIKKQRIIV